MYNYNTKIVFENPTEFFDSNSDYRKINPEVMSGTLLEEEPNYYEKKKIVSHYNKAAIVLLGYHFGSTILGYVFVFIIQMIVGVAFANRGISYTENVNEFLQSSSANIIANILIFLTLNCLTFFAGCKICKINISSLFGDKSAVGRGDLPKLKVSDMLMYICFALGIQYGAAELTAFVDSIFHSFGYHNYTQNIPIETSTTFALMTLYGCIIAPITEELVFRGFVLKAFSAVSQKTGIIVSAFLFALIHNNIAQFLLAFPTGLLLGYVALKYGSLLPCMLIHFSVNTMSTLLGDIFPRILSPQNYNTVVNFLVTLIIVLAVVSWFGISQKDRFPQRTRPQSRRGFIMSSFFLAVFIGMNIYQTVKLIVDVN